MYQILQERCNFDITILYYAKVGDALDIDGVKTVFFDKEKIGGFAVIKEIAKYIRQNNIDIMHAFGGCSANIYGRAGAALCRKVIPVGAMLGKKHFAGRANKYINSLLNLFGNWWTINNLEMEPILRRDLRFVSKERIKLLHNGFIPAERIDYHTEEKTEYDRDKGSQFVFTVLGRLAPVKNYGLFIKAAAQIAQKYENTRFWVIGNGSEAENLQQLAEDCGVADKVRFWGYRTDTDVALSRSDVFVQTSFTEGSPNTIAEAMRARKPIISTQSTDLSEMIRQGENGFVVANDNLPELVSAMETLLEMSPQQRQKAGEVSYELFKENFLDCRVAAEFEKFYHEILGR
ncbi:MAG: glycosyltransferase [Oscillospiraceae bacterium]|nr:glycosyltransferase [Oscillospiraceae bacterium]